LGGVVTIERGSPLGPNISKYLQAFEPSSQRGRASVGALLISRLHWKVPFQGDPKVRWLVVPGLVCVYVPVFLGLYGAAGRVAFGFGFLAAVLAAALAGIGPGIAVAATIQCLNFALARFVGDLSRHHVASAIIAFCGSVMLVLAIGALRHLLQKMMVINDRLDEQIQARRRTERDLEENLQLHRNLLSTLGEGVGLFDADDRFVFANAAAEQLFAVGSGELVGCSLSEFLTPEARRELGKWRAQKGASPLTYDLVLAGEAPRIVLVTETRMAQGPTGEPRTLRVLRDVTVRARLERERRELDQHLQRTQALQSLAVLAGGVAHDFNNLLSGIIGSTELALLKLTRAPSAAKDCLEESRRFALEASELSRKMLAYAGKRSIVVQPANLADEVAQSLRLVGTTVLGRAELSCSVPERLPTIRVDKTGFHQVVTNLILNGVEAMDGTRRGKLVLTAEAITVRDSDAFAGGSHGPTPGQYVMLAISDTGCGMSEQTLSRLFEPFFSTKFQGRGMGLAASLGIIRAHGGGLTVHSILGAGTTFRVFWPIDTRQRNDAASTQHMTPLDGRGVTVLLVDDESAVRQVTGQLLEQLGCRVLHAGGGIEALGIFRRQHDEIQLVVLDLTMPELNGYAVLSALRAIDSRCRVILTSGYSLDEGVNPSDEPGVVGFLQKPHSLAGLEAALSDGLSERRSRGRARAPRTEELGGPHAHGVG
jgi:PAS domain S-box-containing protein